jgi:hypothetical protein
MGKEHKSFERHARITFKEHWPHPIIPDRRFDPAEPIRLPSAARKTALEGAGKRHDYHRDAMAGFIAAHG